jgi:16S rRNA (cytosine1402-N4)-methyltransferase
MAEKHAHAPVLLDAALEGLRVMAEGCYLDGTFGRGGHARAILARLGDAGRLYALDRDPAAVAFARAEFAAEPRLRVEQGSFADLSAFAQRNGIAGRVDGLLLDLGVSSPQLDDPARGFSFQADGPLDMRMDPGSGESAADWLARAPEREIATVLSDLGEERFARRIARAIVQARTSVPLRTTAELAALVARASPARDPHKHPATRTFQAIRIFVNRELEALAQCLEQSLRVLAVGARLVVISFHSLEDRIVKRFMRDRARGEVLPRGVPVTGRPAGGDLRVIGKPVRPDAAEVACNPRARSAVLRVAERVA